MADTCPEYSELDKEFSKLLKCVYVAGEKTMCDVAKQIYSCDLMDSNNGCKSLKSFMEEKDLQITFNDEQFLLDCNIKSRTFGIPFAFKVITEICECVYRQLSPHCQRKIKSIVQMRDQLCFDYNRNLTILRIQARLTELKGTLSDIYTGVAKVLNKGLPKSKRINSAIQVQKILQYIENIMKTKVIYTSTKILEEFKEQLFFKIVRSITTEICELYSDQSKYRVLSPCTWTDDFEERRFDLDTVYTIPKLTQNQGNIEMQKMLTIQASKGGISMTPETLVIKGEAGSGKTSLCRYIVNTWTKQEVNVSGINLFQLLLFVEIRRTTAKSVEEFLATQIIKKTLQTFNVKDVLKAMKQMEVLIIVDGYDESNKTSDMLLNDIYKVFQKNRIILTSRTCSLSNLMKIVNKYNVHSLLLDLQGFNAESRKNYIMKVFEGVLAPHKENIENRERFQKYIDGRGQVLKEHLNLPLTVALLIVLWLDNPANVNNVTTATSLYQELFKLFQKKLKERLISQGKFKGAEEVLPRLEKLLLKLGEQAWKMLKDEVEPELTQEFEERVRDQCAKHEIDSVEFLSAFLKCEIDSDGDDKQNVYYFLHRTQTEYVAALFLAEYISKEKAEALQIISNDVKDWEQYQQLFLYLIGNMALKNTLQGLEWEVLELISEAKVSYLNFSYWWNLVSESRVNYEIRENPSYLIQYKGLVHPKIGEIIANHEKFLYRHTTWEPNRNNVAPALRLIALIPVTVGTLKIDIPEDVEPFHISDFIEAIEEVGKHKQKMHGQRNRRLIDTEIKLHKHVVQGTTVFSDRFILATKGWAKLTLFHGSLENRMVLGTMFPKLKNICCKITTPEVLKNFKNIGTNVNILRIAVAFSEEECSPTTLEDLDFRRDLEFTFNNINDNNFKWMTDVLIKLTERNGFEMLELKDSKLSYESIELLIDNISPYLNTGLRVNHPEDRDEEKERKLEELAHRFTIHWVD